MSTATRSTSARSAKAPGVCSEITNEACTCRGTNAVAGNLKLEADKRCPGGVIIRNPNSLPFENIAVRLKCKGCGAKREFHMNNYDGMAFFHERAWGNGHDIGEDK